MSSVARRLKRQQHGAASTVASKLSEATKQVAGLNQMLAEVPAAVKKLEETSQVLDALVDDTQLLANELEFVWFVLKDRLKLTADEESQLRGEFAKQQDEGQ